MNWLSYFTPLSIHIGKTNANELIEIREIFGRKKMDIGGYPQSGLSYQRCWRNIFLRSNIYRLPNNSQVLVLGLGGGDIVKILKQNRPSWHLTIVEIEPEIVKIAKNYFGIYDNKKLKIETADAKLFMQRTTSKYNLIIVDLYNGDSVPKFVATANFLKNTFSSIEPKGYVLFNYASHSFHENNFLSFKEKLNNLFSKVDILRYWGHSFYLTQK